MALAQKNSVGVQLADDMKILLTGILDKKHYRQMNKLFKDEVNRLVGPPYDEYIQGLKDSGFFNDVSEGSIFYHEKEKEAQIQFEAKFRQKREVQLPKGAHLPPPRRRSTRGGPPKGNAPSAGIAGAYKANRASVRLGAAPPTEPRRPSRRATIAEAYQPDPWSAQPTDDVKETLDLLEDPTADQSGERTRSKSASAWRGDENTQAMAKAEVSPVKPKSVIHTLRDFRVQAWTHPEEYEKEPVEEESDSSISGASAPSRTPSPPPNANDPEPEPVEIRAEQLRKQSRDTWR